MYIIIDDRIQHVGDGMWLSMIKVTIELNYYATSPFDVRCPFHVEKRQLAALASTQIGDGPQKKRLGGLGTTHGGWISDHDWLVVWNMNFMIFHILGMSSSQLTFIFFRGVGWNHQPDEVSTPICWKRSAWSDNRRPGLGVESGGVLIFIPFPRKKRPPVINTWSTLR